MGSLRGMLAAPALIALLSGSGGIAVAQVPTPAVSWKALEDVPPTTDGPLPLFHDYSWRSFIALNWPAATGAARRPVMSTGAPTANPQSWILPGQPFGSGARRNIG